MAEVGKKEGEKLRRWEGETGSGKSECGSGKSVCGSGKRKKMRRWEGEKVRLEVGSRNAEVGKERR
jgi:hypothetical protein